MANELLSDSGSLASLLELVRANGPTTRRDLAAATGLGRGMIAQQVDELLERGVIRISDEGGSTGGRPPSRFVFNTKAGVVLAADLGATHAHLLLSDLGGSSLSERRGNIAIAEGPDRVLDWVEAECTSMLKEQKIPMERVRVVGIGVPGPVEFSTGRPVIPPIMAGWDGYGIPERLQQSFPVPVLVDNDVNLMAIGEHASSFAEERQMLFVKVATGIGCGIIVNGEIYRGADGAAGDIGHIRLAGHEDVVCECGNSGCLEAVAGGRALARALSELGSQANDARDVIGLVRKHDPQAVRAVREAGRQIGDVLSGLVNALNPNIIVVGGDMADAQEQLFAGIREVIYQRSTVLATRRLEVSASTLGESAGVVGATALAIRHVVDHRLLV